MAYSSPLISGPDFQSFSNINRANPNGAPSQSPSRNGLGTDSRGMTTSPPPPPPGLSPWGSNQLGGEALDARLGEPRRAGSLADPIGSRPNSRTGTGSPSFGASANRVPPPTKRFSSQRASASAAAAVAAAATSAAARSRATSPANTSQGDVPPNMMTLGAYNHLQDRSGSRLIRSSSPSYMTARSNSDALASCSDRHLNSSNDFFGPNVSAGTPKLVVDEPETTDSMLSIGQTGSDMSNNIERANSINFDSTAASAATSPTAEPASTPFGNFAGPFGNLSFSDNNLGDLTKRVAPQALRSDTTPSFGHQYANMPAASASTSSLNHNATLLSPSAAANVFTSPLGSAPGLPSQGGGTLPFFLNQQGAGRPNSPSANLAAMQSFASFTDRSGVASPSFDVFQPMMSNSGLLAGLNPDFDSQLTASRAMQEYVDRLARVESSIRDLNRSVSGLNRNVSILLDRTKHMAGSLGSQNQRGFNNSNNNNNAGGDDLRSISAQVALLSNSMSQLLGQNSSASAVVNSMPGSNTPLAGLGLAGSTPQLGGGSTVSTPQLGTFPGTPAYLNGSRFGGMANTPSTLQDSTFRISTPNLNAGPHDRNSRLSPRPGASPGPQSTRRWSSMMPGTPDAAQPAPNGSGAMNPPDPSVIVTKWEHLNLHADLLRSILKYGLGPPNKIQQRALPFLLRGSDIIAQAPPTQERIASYVIPVLQLVLNITRGEAALPPNMGVRGPIALIISTTVDQATQAQRMAMGLGAALGIRVHIAAASSLDVAQEASALIQTQAQIVVGTPQKMMDMFNYLANNTKGAVSLADVRCIVLDEVDQLIARNLSDHVSALLRILPTPRVVQYANPAAATSVQRAGSLGGALSPGLPGAASPEAGAVNVTTTDRQTAIFSNTVPQDVLNFAQSIHLRESVRVLVRREGGAVMGGGGGGGSGSAVGNTQGNAATGGSSLPQQSGVTNSNPGQGPTFNATTQQQQLTQQSLNTLGASPANNHANPMSDPILSSLRGLRQYYLYVAVTTGAQTPNTNHGSQIAHAMEMKLDVITDLLEDIDFSHAVVYTSTSAAHEAVTYKLASKGIEALGLHREMASSTRQQVLAKYRSSTNQSSANYHAAGHAVVGGVHTGGAANDAVANAALQRSGLPATKKALVVHDVIVSPKDVHQVPLILFYDLPRSVEEYKEKIACAASGGANARPSVCVNVVTGSGGPRGDIEMLRTLECHLGCKMAELPMNSSQILQF